MRYRKPARPSISSDHCEESAEELEEDKKRRRDLFDLKIMAKGDLDVDIHHTNEDVGITLGEAFAKTLGAKKGIRRFGSKDVAVPMEEALARVALDISARPSLHMRQIGR